MSSLEEAPREVEEPNDARAGAAPEPIRVLVPSAIGSLGLEFHGVALGRIEISPTGPARKRYPPLSDYERSDFFDEVVGRLSEYLAGVRRAPDVEYDLASSGVDAFARRVLREVARVPYARTRTYKDIAELVGRKEAYRQVLSIVERNPLPLVIPCHRIIPSRDGLGGYVGGVQRKRWLLRLERDHAQEFASS